ncbi:MAG: hypothetical protein NT091_01540 [Candidatus Falkowbacteria bacterium]|nr:hypothetical protein [Candidatus Falkowbacteria bacterium]
MAACDIEERLRNNEIIDTQIKQIYALLINNLKLPENSIYEKDKKIQIYVSIHRKLLKFDDWMLSFILFKYLIPNWSEADDKLIKTIAENLVKIRESVSKQVDHPIKGQLDRIISRYSVFFNILTDAIAEDPNGAYKKAKTNHKEFATNIKKICEKKYAQARSKLWRAALRSILYIFITKSVFVVLFEIPISKWLNQEVTPISLVINIGFPALLLFLIVLFSHVPSSDSSLHPKTTRQERSFYEHHVWNYLHYYFFCFFWCNYLGFNQN